MEVIIGTTITRDFTVTNPTTGQVSDADFLPTCNLFEEDTDIPILSPAVVKRLGFVGDYRVTFDVTVANGFVVGKSYNLVATVTVVGFTQKAPIAALEVIVKAAHYEV